MPPRSRATRQAPPSHPTHGAGEEFLVLEGVFSDETGDFPVGFYVRNPPGSRHTPASAPGTVILVKLRQMPPEETVPVRLDTHDPALWHDLGHGRQEAVLFDAPWERVVMLRLAPGHAGAAETWPCGIELFVVEGDLVIDGTIHRSGAWLRLPPDSCLAFESQGGALLYRKTGHLR